MKSWQNLTKFPRIAGPRLCNLQATIPGGCLTSGYCYSEVAKPPSNYTQRLQNLRVTLLGGCAQPLGIVTWRLDFMEKALKFLILNSHKSFKTEFIYKNHLWLIGTCLGKKRWGHLRTFFATSGYRYQEVVNIFVNISVKTKKFSKIFWGVAQGPRYY